MVLHRWRSAPALITLADATITGLWAVAGLRRPATLPERDRTLRLRVADRQVVALDEKGGRAYPRGGRRISATHLAPRCTPRHPSAQRPDPAVFAVRRTEFRRLPHRGPPNPRRRGGSIEVHDALPVGSVVTTSGPRNAFPLSVPGYGSPTKRLRFIAGGIGITPILPMLDMAERLGIDWSMIYVGRSAESIPLSTKCAGSVRAYRDPHRRCTGHRQPTICSANVPTTLRFTPAGPPT